MSEAGCSIVRHMARRIVAICGIRRGFALHHRDCRTNGKYCNPLRCLALRAIIPFLPGYGTGSGIMFATDCHCHHPLLLFRNCVLTGGRNMWFRRQRERGVSSADASPYAVVGSRHEGLTLKCVWCGKRVKMFVGPKAKGTIYGLCRECRATVLAARTRFYRQ